MTWSELSFVKLKKQNQLMEYLIGNYLIILINIRKHKNLLRRGAECQMIDAIDCGERESMGCHVRYHVNGHLKYKAPTPISYFSFACIQDKGVIKQDGAKTKRKVNQQTRTKLMNGRVPHPCMSNYIK